MTHTEPLLIPVGARTSPKSLSFVGSAALDASPFVPSLSLARFLGLRSKRSSPLAASSSSSPDPQESNPFSLTLCDPCICLISFSFWDSSYRSIPSLSFCGFSSRLISSDGDIQESGLVTGLRTSWKETKKGFRSMFLLYLLLARWRVICSAGYFWWFDLGFWVLEVFVPLPLLPAIWWFRFLDLICCTLIYLRP